MDNFDGEYWRILDSSKESILWIIQNLANTSSLVADLDK